MKNPQVVLFGGGVQSTAIAEMVLGGSLPRPDLFVFADTGDEPEAVYPHIKEVFARLRAAGLECLVVKHESGVSLSEFVLDRAENQNGSGAAMPPVFVKTEGDDVLPLRRKCTSDFKINVMKRAIKRRFDVPRRKPGKAYDGIVVEQWFGISMDERQRMRESQEPWTVFRYPLVEQGLSRSRCITYLRKKGIEAPRSACVYCPFHSNNEWRKVKANPRDWQAALEFERRLRAAYQATGLSLKSEPFCHRSRVPLDQVNLGEAQGDLFGMDNECAGICGV